MAVKIEFMVFWVVVPCSMVNGYQPWRWRQHGSLKWYPSTTLHGATTHKAINSVG
jgi:hypothetical protein